MSIIVPPTDPDSSRLIGYNPQRTGCTYPGCGTQQTETLSGLVGRRCSQHPPEPPWIAHADAGRFTEAFRALRAHLATRARWSA